MSAANKIAFSTSQRPSFSNLTITMMLFIVNTIGIGFAVKLASEVKSPEKNHYISAQAKAHTFKKSKHRSYTSV